MYSSTTPHRDSRLSSILLILVPMFLFPTALLALFYNFAAIALTPPNTLRRRIRRSNRFKAQNVLISGASTPAGLRVSRALFQTGHNVIGVDTVSYRLLSPAKYSRAIGKFYAVRSPTGKQGPSAYIQDLLNIVLIEGPSLWIDCSEAGTLEIQAQAKRIIERKSSCACLAADTSALKSLGSRQSFESLLTGLQLPVAEAHQVHSRNDIHGILNGSNGKKYELSAVDGADVPAEKAILPKRTLSQTYHDISRIKISRKESWLLKEYLGDHPTYTAFSVVTDGKMKAFAVRSQIGIKGDLELVPATSGLHQAMRTYMEGLLSHLDVGLSSPLSIDFCVVERPTKTGVVQQIVPTESRLATDATILLFTGWQGSVDITQAFLSQLGATANGLASYTGLPYHDSTTEISEPRPNGPGVFYFDQDIRMIVESIFKFLKLQEFLSLYTTVVTALIHLGTWQEARYEFWDPLPAFWYYFVQGPFHTALGLPAKVWNRPRVPYTNGHVKKIT